jgi:nucleoside-diphosphate-sugar epimerase
MSETTTEKRNILITGGAGYIGSILSRILLAQGHNVTILDRLFFGDISIRSLPFFYPDTYKLIEGDIRNESLLRECMEGVDTVFHLAAIVGDPACAVRADETVETNGTATKNIGVLAEELNVNRLIYSSTCSVYGASEDWLDEESQVAPNSLYGQTKLNGEQYLLAKSFRNLEVVVLRLGTIFGLSPRMRFDLVVNYLTQKAIIDRKIKILGGQQWRPFLYVKDAAKTMAHLANLPFWDKIKGEIFNIGSNENNYKMDSLGDVFHTIFPETEIERVTETQDHRSYKVKFDKIAKTGITLGTSLESGIREIVEAIHEGVITDPSKPNYYNYRVWD